MYTLILKNAVKLLINKLIVSLVLRFFIKLIFDTFFTGTIPAPILFGWLIDQSCMLWQDSCDDQHGSCLFYNNEIMSRNILSIVCLVKFLSCVFFFISWYSYQPPESSSPSQIRDSSFCEPSTSEPQLFKSASGDNQCVGVKYLPRENDGVTSCEANTSSILQ